MAPEVPVFSVILGVDQTGAKGRRPDTARPLPACLLWRINRSGWKLKPARLPSLTQPSIRALLTKLLPVDHPHDRHPLAIVVDSVIGLPESHWPGPPGADALWQIMRQTHNFRGFGREAAAAFFRTIDRLEAPGGLRLCEQRTGANSVFLERPYQRNVQTGTFRIWKDLTATGKRRWLRIWPFESPTTRDSGLTWLFEIYPSMLWHTLFGLPTRAPDRFEEVLDGTVRLGIKTTVSPDDLAVIRTRPDFADAAVAALGAAGLQQTGRLWAPDRDFKKNASSKKEGWLIGLSSGEPQR